MTNEPPERTPTSRVTVVDFDMPFGSMVVFMLKWGLAAIPAMLILFIVGAIVSAVFAGMFTGIVGAMRSSSGSSAAAVSSQALVVTVRPTATGWQLSSDSSVRWRTCELSIGGHTVQIAAIAGNATIQLATSEFTNGGAPPAATVADRDVTMTCRSPEQQTARIYLIQ